MLIGERRESVDAAAGEESGDHFKGGVLRSGPDQADRAPLDIGQKGILLSLVEAMNLINEENGSRAEAGSLLRVRHYLLDFLDAAEHRGELDEAGLRGLGDDLGQGGLAHSWRTPQNHGPRVVALDLHAQGHARTKQLVLAHVFLQGAGTHALGERSGPRLL